MNDETEANTIQNADIDVDWEKKPSLHDLKKDLLEAQPSHNDQVQQIDTWLDNLNVEGQAKVNTPKGHSQVVPRLIRKQAEWRYSALSEPFLSSPDLFEVNPVTWEDRESARQNGLVLNNQFNARINKNRFIDEYVRTAVDEGTAIIKVGWDFQEETYEEEETIFEYVEDPESVPLHQELAEKWETSPSEYHLDVPEELQQAHDLTRDSGIPYMPEPIGTELVEKSRTIKNEPTLEICDYKNVYIDPTCNGDLDKASFVIYSFEASKSMLEKDGRYENLDKINLEANTIVGEPDHATTDASSFNFNDEARKKFVVYEYWGYWDIDDSGIVKPIVAAWVGDTLIRLEDNPYPDQALPFVSVQYLPVRKSIYGEPDGALLEDNQKILGAVTRGMIDLLGKSANGQTGMRKDMLDATNRRKFERGEDYEFNTNTDPRQGIHQHTFPEIPNSAQFMLQLQNHEAESLTGVKAFHGGISGDSLGETATGARGAMDAASKRETGILRRLADGLTQIGRKIIAMNGDFLSEEETIRITNEHFETIRRDDLSGHFDLRLAVATAEEDNAKAEELAYMLQTMGNNVDFDITKMILTDIARLRKMPTLAKKVERYEPQPDPIAQQKAQLELMELQAKIAEIHGSAQNKETAAILNQARAMTEQARAENISSDTDLNTLDFVEQESGVKQERDLEKQGEQARGNMELKAMEHQINQQEKQQDLLNETMLAQYIESRA